MTILKQPTICQIVSAAAIALLAAAGQNLEIRAHNSSLKVDFPAAIAQTASARKAEADRLFQQGNEIRYEVKDGKFREKEAIELWEKALAIYREIKDERREIAVLEQLSYEYYNLGQYQKALDAIKLPFEQIKQAGDRDLEASYLGGIGDSYLGLKQYQPALQSYQQEFAIAQQAGDRLKEAYAVEGIVKTYRAQGQIQQANQAQQRSLTVDELLDRQSQADKLYDQGLKQFRFGQIQAALQSWQQARSMYRELGGLPSEAKFLNRLAIAYSSQGQYQQAIQFNQQALEIARQIQYRGNEADFLSNLGFIYVQQGKPQQALSLYQQAREIYSQIGYHKPESSTLQSLGVVADLLGKPAEAMQFHQQSFAIVQIFGGRQVEADSRHELGLTYNFLGKYQRAIQFLKQGLQINQEIARSRRQDNDYIDNTTHIINSLDALGFAYQNLGQYQQAIEVHKQALEIVQSSLQDTPGWMADALKGLGDANYSLGKYQQALAFYQQGLELVGKNQEFKAIFLNSIGSIYNTLGKAPKAIELYQQSLQINRELGNSREETQSLDGLGIAYRLAGQYEQAIKSHQQASEIATQTLDPLEEAKSLDNLGADLLATENPAQAETFLRRSLDIYESLRQNLKDSYKVSIFDTQRYAYNRLQQALINQNKIEAALEVAERGRARAFVDLLARRLAVNPAEAATIAPLNITQIKQIAQVQNATIVQYSLLEDNLNRKSELYTWVIKPAGEIAFHRQDFKSFQNQSLTNLIASSRAAIGVRGRGGIEVVAVTDAASQSKQLQKLHELLIKPIAKELPQDPQTRVIFVPQESLFLVPFAALQDDNGKYLIEQHTILTAPSIQVLNLTRQQRQNVLGKGALVVGNPTMPSIPSETGEKPEQLPSLPGAEAEAAAIAKLLNTKTLTGNQATKSAVLQQLPQARFIHLATHGLLDDFKGLGVPGAIALAPDLSNSNGEEDEINGLLTASEILDLKLTAELVVLSACDTGRGTITGDGVIGLSRALIAAGVPSAIVSLWSVPDAPTASLMTEFYRQMQQQPDKAQALRQAMLATMKQHPNPRDWAAFTLIGEAE